MFLKSDQMLGLPTSGRERALVFAIALDLRRPASIPPEVVYDRGTAIAELVTSIESESSLEVGMIRRSIAIGAPVSLDHETVKDSGPRLADNPFAFSEDIVLSGAVGATGDKAPDIGFKGKVVLAKLGSDTSDTAFKRTKVASWLHPGKAVLDVAKRSCTKEQSSDTYGKSHV
ncbi:MAG: hypothetical protein KIH67_001520 [Candidatus Moranbacteria bacterium]|nr:hypothetical protein [Candidatus Moranbacteria bacterium]